MTLEQLRSKVKVVYTKLDRLWISATIPGEEIIIDEKYRDDLDVHLNEYENYLSGKPTPPTTSPKFGGVIKRRPHTLEQKIKATIAMGYKHTKKRDDYSFRHDFVFAHDVYNEEIGEKHWLVSRFWIIEGNQGFYTNENAFIWWGHLKELAEIWGKE